MAATASRGAPTGATMTVSLNRDVAAPDDLGPERGLVLELGGKLLTRVMRYDQAKRCEVFGDGGIVQRLRDRLIEQLDDRVRRSTGRSHAPPVRCGEPRKAAFDHGRYVGQRGQPRFGRGSERHQLAALQIATAGCKPDREQL